MVRLMTITLAVLAAITIGFSFNSPALARGMGHAGSGGGHPGFSHSSGFGHAAFGHPGGFRHRFFGPGFVGVPYDSCYARVWTSWGWRWVNVCY
jgi:hypothetical protein